MSNVAPHPPTTPADDGPERLRRMRTFYTGWRAQLAALDVPAAPGGAAASGLEQVLLGICQAALPNHTLSPDDNLFELGTGSLTLAQIYEKVEAMYPGRLEVTDFFEYPTVRSMAGFLAEKLAAEPA